MVRDAALKVGNVISFMSSRTQVMSLIWLIEIWNHLLHNKVIIIEIKGQGHEIGDIHLQGHQGIIDVQDQGHMIDMTVTNQAEDIQDIGQGHLIDINYIAQNTGQGHQIKGYTVKEVGQGLLNVDQVVLDNDQGLLIGKVGHEGQR